MGQNWREHRKNSHLIIHCLTSKKVSELNERVNHWAQQSLRAKQVVQSEQTSKWSEWPSTSILYSWLFWPTVQFLFCSALGLLEIAHLYHVSENDSEYFCARCRCRCHQPWRPFICWFLLSNWRHSTPEETPTTPTPIRPPSSKEFHFTGGCPHS